MQRTLVILVLAVLAMPALGNAQNADDLKQDILDGYTYTRENLRDQPGRISQQGAMMFWSSGGLMNKASADTEPGEYDAFNIHAKHIEILPIGDSAAVAMYYAEGSMTPKGYPAVPHYFTRVMETYVKENGKWVLRAAHWSPVGGGGGTSQTAQ
jgi:hypothetical protein